MSDFATWFERMAGTAAATPHTWQRMLAGESTCRDRLIRIPTGMGKTLGVLGAWLWNRVVRSDPAWPRRLVWCLPMRVLVEQTRAEAERVLRTLGDRLWDGRSDHVGRVGVHLLMGGSDAGDWHLHPEADAILIGTQDMLLSRALNRGYAAPRPLWPMEFGLLNQDCLWVMDEVQLMDVGLATSAQLQAFRAMDEARSMRACRTWWMSATLQRDWLRSVDSAPLIDAVPQHGIAVDERRGPLWDVRKPCRVEHIADEAGIARRALELHAAAAVGPYGRITLVVLNTVDRALAVHAAIAAQRTGDLHLVHSRFRPIDRAGWRDAFLARDACKPGTDRIIVATQVVEAGVDVSATALVTELAPWPSLVQRFGRAARWGGTADIVVVDRGCADDAEARPYARMELEQARDLALARLADVAQAHIEDFEQALAPEERLRLYPYQPAQLLLRQEIDDLFDTTPDLTGADLDISRFIRSGEERDCSVWWAIWDADRPPLELQPTRDALCSVPVHRVREWLCGRERGLREGCRAFVLDYLDGAWTAIRNGRRELRPGRVVLVDAAWGGYDPLLGFTGRPLRRGEPAVPIVDLQPAPAEYRSDLGQDREDLSGVDGHQTVAIHGAAVGARFRVLAEALGLPPALARLGDLAGRWHDVGKAHAAFRGSIIASDAPRRPDLAKAPRPAWASSAQLYDAGPALGRRAGFRHELASVCALFSAVAGADAMHPWLLGGCRELIEAGVLTPSAPPSVVSSPLIDELCACSAADLDLVAWLVCTHHGKVRAAWHAVPADQEFPLADKLGLPIRGVCDGDVLPALPLMTASGAQADLPALTLRLDPAAIGASNRFGASWRERVAGLQRRHGSFVLAWMEALLRAADIHASRTIQPDPLLAGVTP